MKHTNLIALTVAMLVSCTSRSLQDSQGKSETADDSASALSTSLEDTDFDGVNEYTGSDTVELAMKMAIEQLAAESEQRSIYTLHASYNGYESSMNASYFFDSLFTLVYYTNTWAMEGTGGSGAYYFQSDELVASKEENTYGEGEEEVVFINSFAPVYGYSHTFDADAGPETRFFTEDDFRLKKSDIDNEYSRLISTIKGYSDSVTVNDETVAIHAENIVNYGEDYTETEEFEISKPLFEHLFR